MDNLPWGNNQNLNDNQFYNRINELNNFKYMLNSTSVGSPPNILLTGIRSVGKTVFLKKVKKDLEKEGYLVYYIDFSQAECFKKNEMSIRGLIEFLFKQIIICSYNNPLKILNKKIEKYFKTKDFNFDNIQNINGIPIPIFKSEINDEDLFDFVLKFPEKIYDDNKDSIKGIIILIDEFQIIKQLNNYKESFLWKLRSYIQNQNHVAYVFTGSMSMQDKLISEIASQNGAFGGRMITFQLNPFSKETVESYLNERVHELIFTKEGFERFYKCTSGIPAYVNIFAKLLPKNIELDEEMIINEFDESIYYISAHLINIWSRLSYREQTIIISLLEKPLKRIEIAKSLNVSSGSLSYYLINLQNLSLINLNNNLYTISEPLLARWLKLEYEKKQDYPHNII